jgi:hypothetical protein
MVFQGKQERGGHGRSNEERPVSALIGGCAARLHRPLRMIMPLVTRRPSTRDLLIET